MYRESGPEQPGLLTEFNRKVSVLIGMCWIVAAPLNALTTFAGTMGERYSGLPMLLGVAVQFLWVLFAGGPTGGAQATLTAGVTILALVFHRAGRAAAWREHGRPHSMYTGLPLCPGPALTAKGVVLPVVAGLFGWAVRGDVPGVGAWCIAAAVAQALTTLAYRHERDSRARALRDARLDQEVLRQRMEDLQ
jgi:hypothetical protein